MILSLSKIKCHFTTIATAKGDSVNRNEKHLNVNDLMQIESIILNNLQILT